MEYRNIPYVKLPVSRIVLGTATPPFIKGEEKNDLLDAALTAGITTIEIGRAHV